MNGAGWVIADSTAAQLKLSLVSSITKRHQINCSGFLMIPGWELVPQEADFYFTNSGKHKQSHTASIKLQTANKAMS